MGPSHGPSAQGARFLGVSPAAVRRILLIGYVVLVTAYVAVHLLHLPARMVDLASQEILSLVVVLGLGLMLGAYAHATGPERRFWGLASVGVLFLVIGTVHDLFAATLALSGGSFGQMWSAIFDIAAVASLLTLLLVFSRFRNASVAARIRYVIDVAAITLVVTGALEALVIGPWYDRLGLASLWSRVVGSASPVVGGLAVAGTLTVILGMRFDRWESWARFPAAAIATLALVLLLAPVSYADSVRGIAGGWARSVSDILWITGVYLGLTGAVYRHLERDRPWNLRPSAALELSYGWFPTVLLPAVEVLSLPLLGFAAAQASDPSVRLVRLVIVGAIALTVAVRTLLTVMDTDALTADVITDPLTGLCNHSHYQTRLGQEIAGAVRYGESVSLIALDMDDFARVNASNGLGGGDTVLAAVAKAVERAVRIRDVVCRSAGDEVAVILPGTDAETAIMVAERVLAEIRLLVEPGGRRVTASAGVASLPKQACDQSELVARTDAALSWAKSHGKDRAVVFDPDVTSSAGAEERIRDLRERADHATVRALAAAVDARDEATQDHSRNVARYSVAVAQELGLDERTTALLEYAALLHDVGRIGVPDDLLRRSGPLSQDERVRMQAHAVLGETILSSTTMREILPWVRGHHERWDGTGYPDGLAGEEIPLGARIIAVADAYDAMRSQRPYRAALSRSAALQEIDLGLGTAFDPRAGEAFIDSIGRTYL